MPFLTGLGRTRLKPTAIRRAHVLFEKLQGTNEIRAPPMNEPQHAPSIHR